MIWTIALREFKSLFLSPLAWSVLAIIQFIMAFLFLTQLKSFFIFQDQLHKVNNPPGITDIIITTLYGNAAIILLLISPFLSMRLISEERRNKTLTLLLSAPISTYQIICGKFLGNLFMMLNIILLITLMPMLLVIGGELDLAKFACNILALVCLVSSCVAIGLFMSCMANQPAVAAISSFGSLLLLWIINQTVSPQNQYSELVNYLSLSQHFQSIQTGQLNSTDITYFILLTVLFMALSIRRLENDRLSK